MNLPKIAKLALVFFSYFAFGKLGLALATVSASATAIWAPTGIAIASMLILGQKIWPVIFAAAFITNITTTGDILSSFGIAIGNTLEGVVGALLIASFAGGRRFYDTPRDIFKFVIITFFAGMISASWGLSSLLFTNLEAYENVRRVWLTWWLGDVSGAILIAPLITIWTNKKTYDWKKDRLLEAIVLIFILTIVTGAVFNGLFVDIKQALPLGFLSIPILVWIGLRFDQRFTSASLLILAAIGIWGTAHGLGSFARFSTDDSLLLFQAYLSVIAVTVIALSAVVTERAKIKERFQRTLDSMSEGFQIIGYDWRYIYVNDAIAKQGKNRKEDLLGRTMMEVYPGIEQTELFHFLQKVMLERTPHMMENEFKFPDGSRGWFALRMEPVSEGILILSVDITEQKKDQQELAHDKAEAEALLDSIGDGIMATDDKGRVIMVNKSFEEQMGFKEGELLGVRSFDKILMEDESKNVLFEKDRAHRMAQITGRKVVATHYLVRKNGTKFVARITASPIIIDKKTVGAVKVFHDITEERVIDEMKNEFISMASHELRTPLSVVKGFVSMINSGDYGELGSSFKKPFEHISDSTERLIRIVNEMLDVSRIDAKRMELIVDNFNINDLINEAVADFSEAISSKNLKLNMVKMEPVMVRVDRERALQIIRNILENAVKYTEKGSIEISLTQNRERIIIFVKDTGSGISKQNQEKLFNKFEQIKSKKTGRTGIGLGLYISREIARKMGGDLWIEASQVGKGSVFAYSVPVVN